MPPLTAHGPGASGGPPAVAETVALAESLLTRRSGACVRLADPEDLGGSTRSRVVRVRVAENPFSLPRSLVLKHYAADAVAGCTESFRVEMAGFQLSTALPAEGRACPALVASDGDRLLMVLEDLGRSASLAEKLGGDDARVAERALLGWARSLGRLQATTAGREDDLGALLRRAGVRSWRDPLAEDARAALASLPDLLARVLRVEAAPAAVSEARHAARLLGGTAFRAFGPSEISPHNALVTGNGVRFLDVEWAAFRDVAIGAAALRLPFPGGGSDYRLPPGMAEAMTASWQSEVATVWPDLADPDLAAERLLRAEVLWVWQCTRSVLPRVAAVAGDIGHPGVVSEPPPRVAVPEQLVAGDHGRRTAAVLAAQWARLGEDARTVDAVATAGLADAVVAALRPWGEPEELPLFPAFR